MCIFWVNSKEVPGHRSASRIAKDERSHVIWILCAIIKQNYMSISLVLLIHFDVSIPGVIFAQLLILFFGM